MMKCIQFLEEPEDESEDPEPINIIIKTHDGKTLRLELEVTETIAKIKDAIAPGCEMEPSRQILKWQGTELVDNSKTLEDLGIQDGATLTVEPFKVPVIVNTIDGKQIKIMVDPCDNMSTIKQQLERDSGITAENQKISMNGLELVDDNNTAGFYGIKGGSVLDLEPKSIKVAIEMPDGKTHEILVKSNDTSDSIKAKIEEETGMAAPRQVLKFNGKELPGDGAMVKDMGLKNGSAIKVEVFKVPVTVNTMDGKEIKVMVDPTDTIKAIKKQLEKDSDIPADNQKLFMGGKELADDNKSAKDYGIKEGSKLDLEPKSINVVVEMPDGKKHEIEVTPSDTKDSIKSKIEAKNGMAAPRQVIKFNGKELPDGKTVKDMGIRDGSDIKVEVYKVPVTVNTMDGKQIKVMVDPTDKLSKIKVQLEQDSGLPASNQKLFMHGDELADDNKTAADYGIKGGSKLDLEPKTITITVEMPDGKKHEIDVKPSDTKDTIKDKIQANTGMEAPRQVVKFNGKELPGGKTVKDMGIKDGSDIKVEVFKVPITVNTMDGKQIKFMVDPSEKLRNIKVQLEQESGLSANNQKLFMHGEELADDNKTAADCGIKKGSNLDLEPKSIKVTVEMPDGKSVSVDVKPSDTSDSIKAKIEKETGMAAPRQVLKFDGKELPSDGSTVKAMGIREGSAIKVDIFTLPITVKAHDGKSLALNVEPGESIESLKKTIQKKIGLEVSKQNLKFGDEELSNNRKTMKECGITKGSELTVEPRMDPIIFIDIKYNTLFAVDRDTVIEKGALSAKQGNKLDFTEAVEGSANRDKILEHMKGAPELGVSPQVVVTKAEVEDYELEEAEKVKGVWGVSLKKREKNKKGEEFLFVDPKTGACGELSRKKYVDMKFITPLTAGKRETIEEAEKDTMQYDKYITMIRSVFGIKSAT